MLPPVSIASLQRFLRPALAYSSISEWAPFRHNRRALPIQHANHARRPGEAEIVTCIRSASLDGCKGEAVPFFLGMLCHLRLSSGGDAFVQGVWKRDRRRRCRDFHIRDRPSVSAIFLAIPNITRYERTIQTCCVARENVGNRAISSRSTSSLS